MKRKFIALVSMLLIVGLSASAAEGSRKKKQEAQAQPDTTKPAPAPMQFKEGLFSVSQKDKDWYFEIPDSLMGRRILVVTRFQSQTPGASTYGGEEVSEHMVYWEKHEASGNILLRDDALTIVAEKESDAIAKAVNVSNENPIIASFKPEKEGTNRIKVTSLFEDDNQMFSLGASDKRSMNLGAQKKDGTFIESIRTYPINTEVTVTRTFSYSQPTGAGASSTRLPAGVDAGVVTVKLNSSFVLLPKEPMKPRLFDSRVGFFADGYSVFSDKQQGVETMRFIARYRLEAKPEDIERQKRGELVEPIKPIVYYIDPATPPQWRPYLIQGVNDWNVAFEQAGWKNAIHAEMFPDDPSMSMEDARFCVIRYLASPTANAYGPNVHDPRSGEIIESHVGWYHNVMTLVHDWYQIQVGASDPRARKIKFDDELMGDLVRFVSSHEVGHTLGLRHNMGSSSQTPVEKLRDKAWVEANGHSVSIMDYARFNYVAQPEDNITKTGLYARIGDYDKWAIEFGYKPTYIDDPKEDHIYWNKVIIDRLEKNPRLWFGGEGRDADPRAQTEDLGDDSMLASAYGIKNLQRIVPQLLEWNKEEGDMFANVTRMYEAAVSQYNRYLGHVTRNIGGRYITYKSIEQDGPIYEAVPKDKQKRAVEFLDEYLFKKPTWLVDLPYMANITDTPDKYLYNLVNNVVSASGIFEMAKLTRMGQFAEQDKNNYKPEEYLSDLSKRVFEELTSGKKVDSYRRYVQRKFISAALDVVNNKDNELVDGRTLLLAEIQKIGDKAKKASSADAATKAHWQAIAKMVSDGLEPKAK